jgi:hypothetical protein
MDDRVCADRGSRYHQEISRQVCSSPNCDCTAYQPINISSLHPIGQRDSYRGIYVEGRVSTKDKTCIRIVLAIKDQPYGDCESISDRRSINTGGQRLI